MAERTELDLQLAYINGQEHGGAPVLKDVRLTRDSQMKCENTLSAVEKYDQRIRSESEEQDCLEQIKSAGDLRAQIRWLGKKESEPWNRILTQIDSCLNGWENRATSIIAKLRERVADWRTEIEKGREKERQRLLREAAELEQKAKYDSDEKNARQARVAAKQKKVEAEEFKPKAGKGYDTVEYFEYEINDRGLASKLPADAVSMNPNDAWFNQKIREAKAARLPIPTFPGITVTRKTRIRVH